ncbi:LLM class flavin-dependent oxidoreductase [Nakamurella sp.]|uniref:LLM class flavin-dependent oxidoreductase n=1 Tax=Nakamurella sp. TaxID=1869182 RepID=UPI003784A1F9
MPDLGHELTFGLFLPNPASQAATVVRLAQVAEQQGLDLVGVQDHPYNADLLDTWTLLSHLAAATSTIRLFPGVACLPLRPPAVLARSVASLDLLTGGRVELGLGAGYLLDAIGRMGGPWLTRGEAVDALADAIEVIRAIWTADEPITLGGHYPIESVAPGPAPAHPVGIWVGAYQPRMLSLTARLADGWLPSQAYASPDQTRDLNARMDEMAVDAGRRPADIVRIYNVNGRFGSAAGGFLDGPPAQWASQLTDLVLEQGFSSFLLAPGGDIVSSIECFAQEVAPDVRERVAAARRGGPAEPEPMARAAVTVAAPEGDDGIERDGSWGDAGGLPVQDRPRPPVLDPPAPSGPSHPDNFRNLVAIHDHLRAELEQIGQAVGQVAEGELTPAAARTLISRMTVRQNHWTLGSFCASYCRIVTIHHAVEDAHMFPGVRAAAPQVGAVVDRLEAEHLVIAGVLERFDRALVDLVREDGSSGPTDDGITEIGSLAEHLGEILRSHLAYEEDSLAVALTMMPAPV